MSQIPVVAPSITAEQLASLEKAPLAGTLNPQTWCERQLYGGAIIAAIPKRFDDCSAFRQIPDHQEVWADADADQSIIIELNSYDTTVADDQVAAHYQTELGVDNQALSNEFIAAGTITAQDMPGFAAEIPKYFCISSQRISKYRESEDKANIVQIYMAVLRLKAVTTDLLITFNVPMQFAHGSSSEGRSIMDSAENIAVIQGVLKSIQVKDWSMFG